MSEDTNKYRTTDLERLARDTLAAAGLEREKADVVANGLLEGDLMGASTHAQCDYLVVSFSTDWRFSPATWTNSKTVR